MFPQKKSSQSKPFNLQLCAPLPIKYDWGQLALKVRYIEFDFNVTVDNMQVLTDTSKSNSMLKWGLIIACKWVFNVCVRSCILSTYTDTSKTLHRSQIRRSVFSVIEAYDQKNRVKHTIRTLAMLLKLWLPSRPPSRARLRTSAHQPEKFVAGQASSERGHFLSATGNLSASRTGHRSFRNPAKTEKTEKLRTFDKRPPLKNEQKKKFL